MSAPEVISSSSDDGRGWRGAAALFGIALTTSIFQPAVLMATPFLLLIGVKGVLNRSWTWVAAGLAFLVLISGSRDGMWFVERSWAMLLGGWFVALTQAKPAWSFANRALSSVFAATGSAGVLMLWRPGAWQAVDFAVSDRVQAGITNFVDAASVLRDGESLSPALITGLYEMAETQVQVFPALTGIASMAALGVAWWVFSRVSSGDTAALGPMGGFRFNDHAVWLFIGGLVLLITRWSEPLHRVGSNAVVFMGALYALRGAAVVVFMSGGLSWFGYAMTALGLLLMPPVVFGAALVIGIGDTWLDVRARARELTA